MRKKRAYFLLLLMLLLSSCTKKEVPRYPYWECMNPETFDIMGISILDYDKEWYVEKPSSGASALIPIYDITQEQMGYVVKLPEVYTVAEGGIGCEVQFFQSIYDYNDLIQVRVTVSNETGENISYRDNVIKVWIENQTDSTKIHNLHYRSYDCNVHTTEVVSVSVAAGETSFFEYVFPCNPEVLTSGDNIVVCVDFETNQGPLKFTIPVEVVKAD